MATRVHFTGNALMSPRIYHYTSRRCGHLVTVGSGSELRWPVWASRFVSYLTPADEQSVSPMPTTQPTPMLVGAVLTSLRGVAD